MLKNDIWNNPKASGINLDPTRLKLQVSNGYRKGF